jgi:transcriptional regulator with XRE-family HTH domain
MPVSAPPGPNVRALRAALGISRDRMGRLLEVTPKTVERLEESGRLPSNPLVATRLARIQEIVDLGLLVYTPEGFRQFMATPLPSFGSLSALQLLERGEAERVFGALATDYEGAPT